MIDVYIKQHLYINSLFSVTCKCIYRRLYPCSHRNVIQIREITCTTSQNVPERAVSRSPVCLFKPNWYLWLWIVQSFSLNSAASLNQSFNIHDYAVVARCWAGKGQFHSSGGCVSMLQRLCTSLTNHGKLTSLLMFFRHILILGEKCYKIAMLGFSVINYTTVQV